LTGIIRTSPIPEVIERVGAEGGIVLDKTTARIDQFEGVKRAFDLGFRRVAVSVAGFHAEAISEIKDFDADAGLDVLVCSVCNTCVDKTDVEHIANADAVCASASKILRREIGSKALQKQKLLHPTVTLTEKSKRLVLAYLTEFGDTLVFRTGRLPYLAKDKGPRLKGNNQKP